MREFIEDLIGFTKFMAVPIVFASGMLVAITVILFIVDAGLVAFGWKPLF